MSKFKYGERSPWRAHRQYEDQLSAKMDRQITELFVAISTGWLSLPGEFQKARKKVKLDKDVNIDPSKGEPLSESAWEKMTSSLERAFNQIFSPSVVDLVDRAFGLGKRLAKLPPKRRSVTSLSKLVPKAFKPKTPEDKAALTLGRQRAGTYIKGLTSNAQKKVEETITAAIANKKTAEELQLDLFEALSDINKNWRMIALTELSANQTDSQLLEILSESRQKPSLVMGLSAPGVCKHCQRLLANKVLLLVKEPPTGGGDQVEFKGKTYTAIWPGKTNIGLSPSNWRATVPMHPHCRCGYVQYYDYMSDYYRELDKLAFNF